MAVDQNSAVGQVQTSHDAFAQFFSDSSTAASGSGSFPEFSDYIASLDYSELHRLAKNGQSQSPSYPGAAAVETIHHMVAILREYGIRTKTKANYYTDGQLDSLNEANYYSSMKTFYANMLQGNYTEGATS